MAIGLVPKYIETIELNELSKEQFLVVALHTADKLKWQINYKSTGGIIAYTDNGTFLWNADIEIIIEGNTVTLKSSSAGNDIIDWGRNKSNIKKFLLLFNSLADTLPEAEWNHLYEQLKEGLVIGEETEDPLSPAAQDSIKPFKAFIYLFKPANGYYITPILLNVTILIFILMAITGVNIMKPDSESLLRWGANFRPLTLDGQGWRLLSNCFLHIGLLHLLFNMYALVYIGLLLEPYLGKTRFLSAYLITGIAASLTSLCWYSFTISAGASGAIFGLYGLFLAMLTTNLIEQKARKALLTSIGIFVFYNLAYGLKGGVDNAAHIGGLLSGITMGYAFIPGLKKPAENKLKYPVVLLFTLIILCASGIILKKTSNPFATYELKMKEFSLTEAKALEFYNLPQTTSRDTFLYVLKERGTHYWEANIKLLESLDGLDLPLALRTNIRLLKEYCALRIKNYELHYKAIAENTSQYQQQIEASDEEIQKAIELIQ